MSRNSKIIIAVIAGLFLLCACGAVATFGLLGATGVAIGRAVEPSPVKVSVAAGRIADFDLPSGYRPDVAIDVAGYTFVSYAPGDGHSHIMLIQAPPSVSIDQTALDHYAQQAGVRRNYEQHVQVGVVGQTQATIRGQAVTLTIGEGTNSDGQAYRTMTGIFQGKGGPALISVESPISSWDQATVDAFIASIR